MERVPAFLNYAAPPPGDVWDHMPVWLRVMLAASAWGFAVFSITALFWISFWLCAH